MVATASFSDYGTDETDALLCTSGRRSLPRAASSSWIVQRFVRMQFRRDGQLR